MTIVVTGLSHHTSPLALRERMMLPQEQLGDAVSSLREQLGKDSGVAVLPTCNRIEVYVCATQPAEALHQNIMSFLGVVNRLAESEFAEFLYHYANRDAVSHLFRVAASLDSMVVGENEIMDQIQQAYEVARNAGALNRVLSALLQRALKCGKKVRTDTRIGVGKVSVASIAVDLAESILKDLSGRTAMIVGSGQVSELALKSLIERGVKSVMVLNRTLERARKLAKRYQGEAIILEAIPCHLHRADIVISSTGASELILRAADFERAIEQRGRAPMFVIDIAVPRDIEREAAQVENVYCYDVDDLQGVAERNLLKRQDEINAAATVVQQEVETFMAWRRRLRIEPLIVALTRRFHEIREQEIKKSATMLDRMSSAQRREIEGLSRRIINSLLHEPITFIKSAAGDEQKDILLLLVQQMFGLKDEEQ